MKFCFNGSLFESEKEAPISALSEAVIYGRSVFETLRTYNTNKVFAVSEHLKRLALSAQILRLHIPSSRIQHIEESLKKIVMENALPHTNLRIRIFLATDFFTITTHPLEEKPASWYEHGVAIEDAVFERPFPEAKATSPVYKFFLESHTPDIFETIFFDRQGFLREGNISNVFAVFGKEIATPDERILQGITREKVLQLVGTCHGMSPRLREIHRDELLKADEIFLTNTTKGIVPVRKWGKWERKNTAVVQSLLSSPLFVD